MFPPMAVPQIKYKSKRPLPSPPPFCGTALPHLWWNRLIERVLLNVKYSFVTTGYRLYTDLDFITA